MLPWSNTCWMEKGKSNQHVQQYAFAGSRFASCLHQLHITQDFSDAAGSFYCDACSLKDRDLLRPKPVFWEGTARISCGAMAPAQVAADTYWPTAYP